MASLSEAPNSAEVVSADNGGGCPVTGPVFSPALRRVSNIQRVSEDFHIRVLWDAAFNAILRVLKVRMPQLRVNDPVIRRAWSAEPRILVVVSALKVATPLSKHELYRDLK